jgi:phage terminase large subunit-like protein
VSTAPPDPRLIEVLAALSPPQFERVMAMTPDAAALGAQLHFPHWAHDGQDAPPGDWRTWVIMAGRGFGKTRAGAEWIAAEAKTNGDLRIALVAASLDEARRVMVEGRAGLLAVAGHEIAQWSPHSRLLRFRSGAEATLFSGCSPEALRGPEHHLAWCDELAKWERAQAAWDMLQLGLRCGAHPRVLVTTTPRPGPVLKAIMDAPGSVVTRGTTRANPHLAPAFVETVEGLYRGTRLARQELDGELLSDVPGALLSEAVLERCRAAAPPRFARIVIGVDPPAGDGTCGIVVCAKDADGVGYVLADHSVTARSPEGWAAAVRDAAALHEAELVVVEINQGGNMVAAVLRAADPALRVRTVRAHEGKARRAEPVTMRIEAGRVKFCGRFPELEAELCGLVAGGGYCGPGASPDRADACVWALTELFPERAAAEPRIRTF